MWRLTPSVSGYQGTIWPNEVPPVLRRTGNPTPTPVRSLAGLLHGGARFRRSRSPVRLFARCVSCALPCFSPRRIVGILCHVAAGPTRTAQEEQSPRTGVGAAQAQLLYLRH